MYLTRGKARFSGLLPQSGCGTRIPHKGIDIPTATFQLMMLAYNLFLQFKVGFTKGNGIPYSTRYFYLSQTVKIYLRCPIL